MIKKTIPCGHERHLAQDDEQPSLISSIRHQTRGEDFSTETLRGTILPLFSSTVKKKL
jgi:hypothetical protein